MPQDNDSRGQTGRRQGQPGSGHGQRHRGRGQAGSGQQSRQRRPETGHSGTIAHDGTQGRRRQRGSRRPAEAGWQQGDILIAEGQMVPGFGISLSQLQIRQSQRRPGRISWQVAEFDRPQLSDYVEANLKDVLDALVTLFRYSPASAIAGARFFSQHVPDPDTMRYWSRASDHLPDFLAQYLPDAYTLGIAHQNLVDIETQAGQQGTPVDYRDILGPRCTFAKQVYGLLVHGLIEDHDTSTTQAVLKVVLAAATALRRTGNQRRESEMRFIAADLLLQLGKTGRGSEEMVQAIVLLGVADKNDALTQGGMAVNPTIAASISDTSASTRQPEAAHA